MEKHNKTIWKFIAQIIPEKDTKILWKRVLRIIQNCSKWAESNPENQTFLRMPYSPSGRGDSPSGQPPISPSGRSDFLSQNKPVRSQSLPRPNVLETFWSSFCSNVQPLGWWMIPDLKLNPRWNRNYSTSTQTLPKVTKSCPETAFLEGSSPDGTYYWKLEKHQIL